VKASQVLAALTCCVKAGLTSFMLDVLSMLLVEPPFDTSRGAGDAGHEEKGGKRLSMLVVELPFDTDRGADDAGQEEKGEKDRVLSFRAIQYNYGWQSYGVTNSLS
jgi:hypothetical protein